MAMRDMTRISKRLTLRVYQRDEYRGMCIYHAVIIFFRQSLAFQAGFKLAMYPRMTFNFRSWLCLQSALAAGISHHVHVMLVVKS